VVKNQHKSGHAEEGEVFTNSIARPHTTEIVRSINWIVKKMRTKKVAFTRFGMVKDWIFYL
jgi:hypothetical protein